MDDPVVNGTSSSEAGAESPGGMTTQPMAGSKPVMVFDGDCGFCRKWIERWRSITGDRIEYAPYQEAAARFPHIPRCNFENAVQLLEPNGQVFGGAEAVFRALAEVPGRGWGRWFYGHVPGFAPVSEAAYRLIAGHRRGLSTSILRIWGRGNVR